MDWRRWRWWKRLGLLTGASVTGGRPRLVTATTGAAMVGRGLWVMRVGSRLGNTAILVVAMVMAEWYGCELMMMVEPAMGLMCLGLNLLVRAAVVVVDGCTGCGID
ncbi:hypothetical protein M0R45_035821 [Rubus argutus]|uniref:Uncharacterized protein n=1 Tax=Rubus argutus TaxID=59490 RepID=A0AAW1VX48_RUBAR